MPHTTPSLDIETLSAAYREGASPADVVAAVVMLGGVAWANKHHAHRPNRPKCFFMDKVFCIIFMMKRESVEPTQA